jgi:LysR family glycine cleavage system transcriptional activator
MSYTHETIERFNAARTRMMRLKAVRALPLTALRTFEAAARHSSFTRAAEELHVTQGAVSRQVQALEDRLGVVLFDRAGRRLALSSEGRLLAHATTDALERLGAAISSVTRSGGILTVSMLPSLAASWVAPRMRDFAAAHPDLELRLTASRHLVDFEAEGIDAAVRYGPGGWADVDYELLATEEIFPVCSADYAASLRLREPRDLARANLLHGDVPDGWREWLAAAGCPEIFSEAGVYLDEDTALLRAAAEGEGVALGRSVLVDDELTRGRLVAPFATRIPASFSWWFVTPFNVPRSRNVERLHDWLMRAFAPYRSAAAAE